MQPILYNCKNQRVLIVGFGPIGKRKAALFYSQGAVITVVEPHLSEKDLLDFPHYIFKNKAFEQKDLETEDFVIAATSDSEINRAVAVHCKAIHTPVNVVTGGDVGTVTVMSAIRRGDLTLGVSTGHRFPGLTKKLAKEMESTFPLDYGDYIAYMARRRKEVLLLESEDKIEAMEKLLSMSYIAYKQGD